MTITIIAVILFAVASFFDARSSMAAGAVELWPLYRWPPWKRGPFRLWMYVVISAGAAVYGVMSERYIELFILAGLRFFFGLYFNPKQVRKAEERRKRMQMDSVQ